MICIVSIKARLRLNGSVMCREGLGDPELRTPGPGIPYPDPEFTAPAMEAVNATFAEQTGYCEGAKPTWQHCLRHSAWQLLYRALLVICLAMLYSQNQCLVHSLYSSLTFCRQVKYQHLFAVL